MKSKAWKGVRVRAFFGLLFASLPAPNGLWLAKAAAQVDEANQTQSAHELNLSSGFFATPMSLHQTRPASITSFKSMASAQYTEHDEVVGHPHP